MTHSSLIRAMGSLGLLALAALGSTLGCSGSDGYGNLLAGQACDAFTITTDPTCACCSNAGGACVSGVSPCAPKGASPTCGDPCPAGLSCVEVNGARVCGVESSCVGPSQQSCGYCGVQSRTCEGGSWSDWGACTGQGDCGPGETQACPAGSGTRTCDGSCRFGDCVTECQPGQSETSGCGNCGTTTRACGGDGTWGSWGECTSQGDCSPGNVQSCGNGATQTCSAQCTWGACVECSPGATESLGCGQCQSQVRACTEAGLWGEWSSCSSSGSCVPGTVQDCSGGSQTCTQGCEWGACIPFTCTPGSSYPQSCGLCGTQTVTCSASGTWNEPTACASQGACSPGAVEACGAGSTHVCGSDCQWGTCYANECDSGTAEQQSCGYCGTQTRSCVNGKWTAFSACQSTGVCTPGATSACGNQGSQTCDSQCQWGNCTGQKCEGSFVQSCGVCGIQTRTCSNGVWSSFSGCTGERDCIPGTAESCGDGGTRSCNFQCFWDTCQ